MGVFAFGFCGELCSPVAFGGSARGPCYRVPFQVGDVHDGVIECRLHVGDAVEVGVQFLFTAHDVASIVVIVTVLAPPPTSAASAAVANPLQAETAAVVVAAVPATPATAVGGSKTAPFPNVCVVV
eukprot:COSAG01_NODE_41712_length_448_cov_0.862464_1_plen_125_part_01